MVVPLAVLEIAIAYQQIRYGAAVVPEGMSAVSPPVQSGHSLNSVFVLQNTAEKTNTPASS